MTVGTESSGKVVGSSPALDMSANGIKFGEGTEAYLAEDNALTDSHHVVQRTEGIEFERLAIAFEVQLRDCRDGHFLLLEVYLIRLGREL